MVHEITGFCLWQWHLESALTATTFVELFTLVYHTQWRTTVKKLDGQAEMDYQQGQTFITIPMTFQRPAKVWLRWWGPMSNQRNVFWSWCPQQSTPWSHVLRLSQGALWVWKLSAGACGQWSGGSQCPAKNDCWYTEWKLLSNYICHLWGLRESQARPRAIQDEITERSWQKHCGQHWPMYWISNWTDCFGPAILTRAHLCWKVGSYPTSVQ